MHLAVSAPKMEKGDKPGECRQPLESENSPIQQPAGKQRPQSYNHKEVDSTNTLSEQGSGFPPESRPASSLIPAPETPG